MTYDEVLAQVVELLQRDKRVAYRILKRRFMLDDEYVEDLKVDLIKAKRLASDEEGEVLVWTGASPVPGSTFQVSGSQTPVPNPHSPASYTPPHLAERIRAEQAAMEARGATDGERKTITALFADIKGSTDLIHELDPEEARAILDPVLQLMMDAVHRYEGYVAQALGDGIFALFGAPIAHEDHPQRALYAALLMQDESRRYAERLRREKGLTCQLRVGANTGEVVLRSIRTDDLHTDYVPVGQSTHVASRMESLATPGAIFVSEPTYKLTEGYFEFKALGEAQVKGFPTPLKIYEVVGVGPLRTKLQVAARRGLARFVGRQSELEAMHRALELSKSGRGQIVGVMGEPGVGKSRLFHEFKLLALRGCLVLETFSVSHGKAYPYLPLIDLLKNYFHLAAQDDERTRREKLTGRVLTLDRSLEDILPYLLFLLGLAEPTSPLQQMDPQIRRQRTFEAIKRLLVRESLTQPLIVIFEDLHWLDAETQAFLSLLSESVATARILLLGNYRPEYQHQWGGKTYYTHLRLDPLGREQAEEMLAALLGEAGATHASPLRQFILEKTEGNPFFMEEIVQALREQGALQHGDTTSRPLRPSELQLPTTVQAVLAARMDRLPAEEKGLLQTLAVLGREFSLNLLKRVAEQSEMDLHRLLAHLQDGEFVYEQPAFPEVQYIFKHALTQEVAYNSLLIERRKVLHARTAQAMEEVYRDRLEDHYSELAHHYSRSGNTEKAVDYLHRAGQQAVQRSAHPEAVTHFTAALEFLQTLAETPERAPQELTLQIALGGALLFTKGHAAPEVEHAYSRARELCQQLGETPQLFPALWGLCLFHSGRGEIQTARELGEQLLSLAQSVQDPALLIEAHHPLWALSLELGELIAAREHCEQGIALYNPLQHHSLAFLYGGHDPGVCCRDFGALTLWLLGYPDQALKRSQEALTLARELSHPSSQALTLGFAAILYQYRWEEQATQERAEAAITLSTDQGSSFGLAFGTIVRGWALAAQGQEEGIVQMRQGLAAYRTTGAKEMQSYFLALLAEGCGRVGQREEGLSVLAEALAHVDKTGERFQEAELYRLKGQLTLEARGWRLETSPSSSQASSLKSQVSQAVAQEAEGHFHKAIEIARKQQAKSLELRATMSLARLWQQQGKQHAACNMLSEIYHWFTEGFDTKDLQEAKALLKELS